MYVIQFSLMCVLVIAYSQYIRVMSISDNCSCMWLILNPLLGHG